MRVLLADPPAYTPPYDRSLAAALAAAGADVELVTSRFRFGAVERPRGIRRSRVVLSALVADGLVPSAARREGARASVRHGCSSPRTSRTCCTCSGSARRRPIAGSSDRARRSSSRPTTSSRGGRPPEPASGGRSSPAATASSCTRSGDETRWRRSGSRGAASRHPPSGVSLGRRPAGRRPHRARPRADPPVQGHRGLGRGRPPGRRCASSRRGRPARAAGRAAAHRGRPSRVAPRLPPRPRDPPRALRSDGRALPVPLRDRRLGSASAGARGRSAGDRLRHRRTRRGRRPIRRGRGRRARRRRRHGARPRAPARGSGCAGRPPAAAPRPRVPSSPGRRRRRRTSSSIESCSDVRTRPLPRGRPAPARPLRRGRGGAPGRRGRPPTRPGRAAGREESEELFGDYQLVVDAIGERLYDIRETYAGTLDEPTADEYREAFDRAALKRFRRYASFLEDGE